MKNDLLESRNRRDNSLLGFLNSKLGRYTDIEDDVAPLRARLAANQTKVNSVVQQVLSADATDSSGRTRGLRGQLTDILLRLIRGLRAEGLSTNNTDLIARLPDRPSALRRHLGGTSFAEEARRLLDLGKPLADALVKRRYPKALNTQAETLLKQYNDSLVDGRETDNDGSTGRQTLERLIKDNERIKKALATYFELYQDDEDEADVYDLFRAAAKVVRRGGKEGAREAAQ
jgi:hypothetical protein